MKYLLRTQTRTKVIWHGGALTMLVASLIFASAGCTQSSMLQNPAQVISDLRSKPAEAQPARVLCLWETAEGQGLDGQNARGFAGQILFFGAGNAAPIPVTGAVRIYQYDDYDPADEHPEPIHVFVFESAAWNAHRTEGTLGMGYNVFVPYVPKHRDVAYCGLKVEVVIEDGRSVSSPVTEINLAARPSRHRTSPTAVRRNIARKLQSSAVPDVREGQTSRRVEGRQLESLTIKLPQSQD